MALRTCRSALYRHHATASGRSQIGSGAFLPSELPAVVDLFSDYADKHGKLDVARLAQLLDAVGEAPDPALLNALFTTADTDRSGHLDLDEFLAAADTILATNPQVLGRCTLVVGGPGSGKGVLCARLVAECGYGHVSSGDMLREEVASGTPIGMQAAEMMARGDLVPSEMITTMLRRRLRGAGGRRLLLDGFPRSRQNAIDFEQLCGRPELALHLACDEEVMVQRILKRAQSEGRADDNLETAQRRIAVFRESQAPTMQWLREARVPIIELDCGGSPEDVWAQLLVVGRLMRPAVSASNAALTSAIQSAKGRVRGTLRRVPALGRLSDTEIDSLEGAMREAQFARGQYVFRQGELGDTFYVVVSAERGRGGMHAHAPCSMTHMHMQVSGEAEVVHSMHSACACACVQVSGEAEVVREGEDGEEVVLVRLGSGTCFGERALLKRDVRYAGVVASADEGLQTVSIKRGEFEAMLGPLEDRLPDVHE